MPSLWTKDKEVEFFTESRKFATSEQLFYISDNSRYYAYWPKDYKGTKSTLQSRNSLIGAFTEKYSVDLIKDFAISNDLYIIQSVVCEEIGLTRQSPADVALCKTQLKEQPPENISVIFEVKMSVVWNWELSNEQLICLGDYRTHHGNPGLLRSDTMLKAIGKSINIRVSSTLSANIPIIILGNTPITESYIPKVDHLKKAGIIQGFWSVNPQPLDNNDTSLKNTPSNGFTRMDSYDELNENLNRLISENVNFFSSMKSSSDLGRIIDIASHETSFEKKAERFLSLLRE